MDGNVYDPNTGQLLTWDKFKKRQGQWDMGHKPAFKYSKELERLRKGEISEEEFLKIITIQTITGQKIRRQTDQENMTQKINHEQ